MTIKMIMVTGDVSPDLPGPVSPTKASPPCSSPWFNPLWIPSCCHRLWFHSLVLLYFFLNSIPCESPHVVIGCNFLPLYICTFLFLYFSSTQSPVVIGCSFLLLYFVNFAFFLATSFMLSKETFWRFVQWRWPAGERRYVILKTWPGTRPRSNSLSSNGWIFSYTLHRWVTHSFSGS